MSPKHIYIIHGFRASPQDHWFPWLADKLRSDGHKVDILQLPDSDDPNAEIWIETLSERIRTHDSNTYFVAHSLGAITLLRYLSGNGSESQIGGMVLVSGFADSLPVLPQLAPFTMPGFDVERVVEIVPRRSVVSALDDEIVPYELTERLSQMLRADFHGLYHGGHFLASDGYTELPIVYRELSAMLEGSNP